MNVVSVISTWLDLRDSFTRRCNNNFAGNNESEEAYLRATLRKFPYWTTGHLALAHLAYRQDDAELCYLSSHAVLQLANGGESQARMLIGKSHLLRNEYERALVAFQALWMEDQSTALREEIAACYFGMGELKVAYDWLSDIPASEISPEAQAVLNYCLQKEAENGSNESGGPAGS